MPKNEIKIKLILASLLFVLMVVILSSGRGIASIYSNKFKGKKTASGEIYSPKKLTAAHRSLPLGTLVRVINIKNGRKVIVKINDRGPYEKGRMIDLSYEAARRLGITKKGLAKVKIEVLSREN